MKCKGIEEIAQTSSIKKRKSSVDILCWPAWGVMTGSGAQLIYNLANKLQSVETLVFLSLTTGALGLLHYNAMKDRKIEAPLRRYERGVLLFGLAASMPLLFTESQRFISAGVAAGCIYGLYNSYKKQKNQK